MKTKKPDNICRLKYRLEPKENDVVEFQILEQDASLVCAGRLFIDETSQVQSVVNPDIFTFHNKKVIVVYLRGRTKQLNKRVVRFYGHDLIDRIHTALEEMTKKVFGHCKRIEE